MNTRDKREDMADELYHTIHSLNGVLPPHELTELIRDTLSPLYSVDRAIIYAMIQQKINMQYALQRFR
jgi:hypothetical protein